MRFGQPGNRIQVNIRLSTDSVSRTSSAVLNESSAKYFHIRYLLVL